MKIQDRRFAKLSTRELHDIMRLRIDVFIVEQSCSYPELDGRDLEDGTRHVWMADDLGVVAYLRVLDDDGETRISRVATRNDARSGGFAGALLDHVLDTSDGPWVLDAPTGLAGWYRKRNFTDDGDEFVEGGNPHLPMRREA